jgi:hypothetical protein
MRELTYHFDCVLVGPGCVDGVSRVVYEELSVVKVEIDCVRPGLAKLFADTWVAKEN